MEFVNRKEEPIHDVRDYVVDWLIKHPNSEVHIGCDSQEVSRKINFVTTICLYEIGRGAHVIHLKEFEEKPKSGKQIANMYTKLWSEVVRSVNVADYLGDIGTKITIHLDYNSNPIGKSNQLYDAGIGYAKSKGYDAVGKPDAWASTSCADKLCR
jgi:uncharacterized protein